MKKLFIPPKEINDVTLRQFLNDLCRKLNMRLGNIPEDSTASIVADVVTDLNALQDALKGE